MLPDAVEIGGESLTRIWQRALIMLGATWLMLIALFRADWQAMAAQWWNSSTYNHIVLIPPILVWLGWQRRGELAKLVPRANPLGLIAVAAALMIWVLGSFSGLSLARQVGAVALLPASALLLWGGRVWTGLAFPFAYMAFLVPFGDELVPALQTVTAKLAIALVHASGVRAAINGVFIDTPAGLFVVAEACSGVKFLVAMAAFGVLAANLCFKRWPRRIGFVVLATVVPVLANGVRAWGTIYVAQFKGAAYAGGVDHIIYGWVFFAVVIALILAIGWRFFDRSAAEPMISGESIAASSLLTRLDRRTVPAALAIGALALAAFGAQGWARAADALSAPLARQVDLPDVPGWHRTDYTPRIAWYPRAEGAGHRLIGRYADARGNTVDVFVAIYAAQGEGSEAGGFGQGALIPDSPWAWLSAGPPVSAAKSDRLMAGGTVERYAQTTYRTGSLLTGSNLRLKLAGMADRLLLRERPTIMLILSAESAPGHPAPASIAAFRRAAGPLGPWMDRIAQLR